MKKLPALLPCASVLKPLYAAIARDHYVDKDTWLQDVEPSIIRSNNEATDAIVQTIGGLETLTDSLNSLLFSKDYTVTQPQTWGRYLVNGEVIRDLYYGFLFSASPSLRRDIFRMMHAVPDSQRFGSPSSHRVKAGWDYFRHEDDEFLLTLLVDIDLNNVSAGIRVKHITSKESQAWHQTLEENGPEAVIPMHERFDEGHKYVDYSKYGYIRY